MTRPKATLRARQQSVKAALVAAKAEPAEDRKLVGLSVRLPPELHDRVRRVAYEQHTSIHKILLEGLELALQERGRKK